MSSENRQKTEEELTPVEDVRRVRRELREDTPNDINCLADRATETSKKLRDRFRLKTYQASQSVPKGQ